MIFSVGIVHISFNSLDRKLKNYFCMGYISSNLDGLNAEINNLFLATRCKIPRLNIEFDAL